MCELILKNVKLKPDSHHSWLVITAYTLAWLFLNSVVLIRCSYRCFFFFSTNIQIGVLYTFKFNCVISQTTAQIRITIRPIIWLYLPDSLSKQVHPHDVRCRPLGKHQPKSNNEQPCPCYSAPELIQLYCFYLCCLMWYQHKYICNIFLCFSAQS